jgi:hypothetical protein
MKRNLIFLSIFLISSEEVEVVVQTKGELTHSPL